MSLRGADVKEQLKSIKKRVGYCQNLGGLIMAEMNDNTGVNSTETNNEQNNENNNEQKTYTQEEVLALIQKEADKRVTQALATQQKKYEKQLSLSKLDGDEREKAEKDNRIAELEQQLAEFQIEKNRSELKSVLSARGLSAEFCDIINITDDIEASQANIDKLDKLFKAAVTAEVEKRLAGNAPKGNGTNITGDITREQFVKMPLSQQSALYKSNPELYKKLTTM